MAFDYEKQPKSENFRETAKRDPEQEAIETKRAKERIMRNFTDKLVASLAGPGSYRTALKSREAHKRLGSYLDLLDHVPNMTEAERAAYCELIDQAANDLKHSTAKAIVQLKDEETRKSEGAGFGVDRARDDAADALAYAGQAGRASIRSVIEGQDKEASI